VKYAGWGDCRRVVEVDIEKQLLMIVFRLPFSELPRNGAVGRADVAVDDFAKNGVHVSDLSELDSAPVVQQPGTLLNDQLLHACFPRKRAVVEGVRVQPQAVQRPAQPPALVGCQESAVFEVLLPFLERVDVAPLLSNTASVCDLLEESKRKGDRARDVRGLAGVVGQELGEVLEGAELGFSGVLKEVELLRGRVYLAEAAAGGG